MQLVLFSQSTLKVVAFQANINRYMTLSTARSILQAFNFSLISIGLRKLLILGVCFRQTLLSVQKLIIWLLQLILSISSVLGIDQMFTLIQLISLGVKLLIIRIANVPFWIARILGYIQLLSQRSLPDLKQNGFLPILFLLLRLTLMRSLILHYMLQVSQIGQVSKALTTSSTSPSSLKFVDKNNSSELTLSSLRSA